MGLNVSDGSGLKPLGGLKPSGAGPKLDVSTLGTGFGPSTSGDACTISVKAHQALDNKVKCQDDAGLGFRR